MSRRLLVFANAFPFGTWEPFLQREMDFYSDFDQVVVFSLSVRRDQLPSSRELPEGIEVVPIQFRSKLFYAVRSVSLLWNSEFRAEIRELLSSHRFRLSTMKQAMVFFARADYEASVIKRYVAQEIEFEVDDVTTMYSYRFLYQPYLMSRVMDVVPGARLVSRAHRADLYENETPHGYLPYRRRSLEILDQLSLISRHGYEYVKQTIPGFDAKLSLDYMGTEDRGISVHPPQRSPLRVVTCSNVVPVKRLHLVVQALETISEDLRIDWTHYGDGPLMEELEQLTSGLPSSVAVHLVGVTANEQILTDYGEGRYHVFVNVSESEGLPISIMEACSFGIPVIATDAGGTAEIVKDGQNGRILHRDFDPRELAQALEELATMPDSDYWKLSRGARMEWKQGFDSATNYSNFVRYTLQAETTDL